MKKLILRKILVLAALITVSSVALAQYSWIDEKGVKQFSDQPPPTSIPKKNILKFSGKPLESQDSESDLNNSMPKSVKSPENAAEKEVAYKKRHDETMAKEKKEAEDSKAAAVKSDSCKRMREYKSSLDSGQRIPQIDSNGNKSFMTDDKRTQEMNTVNQNLGECSN